MFFFLYHFCPLFLPVSFKVQNILLKCFLIFFLLRFFFFFIFKFTWEHLMVCTRNLVLLKWLLIFFHQLSLVSPSTTKIFSRCPQNSSQKKKVQVDKCNCKNSILFFCLLFTPTIYVLCHFIKWLFDVFSETRSGR